MAEITDIFTWIQAFPIYLWIFCSTYPSRWQDTTQYKLLILQMASHFPGPAWLNYDTAFRKDAAASLLADWSKMNLDVYNFHTRASGSVTSLNIPILYLNLIERPTQAFLQPHSALLILERWCLSLVCGSMPVPSCL